MSTPQSSDAVPMRSPSLVVRFGQRFGIEPAKMLDTLRATAFKTEKPASNEQMLALLVVAEQYNLNPFTKELFAFVDKHSGGIVPVVSVDGWARIVNEHPQYDGSSFDFHSSPEGGEMVCTMYRKDRSHPTILTEYMSECRRQSIPWQVTPRRMLRHRAFIQAARLTFGFAGIFDEGEARDIIQMGPVQYADPPPPPAEEIDPETGEIKPRTAVQKAKETLRARVKSKTATPPEQTPPAPEEPPSQASAEPDWPAEPSNGEGRHEA